MSFGIGEMTYWKGLRKITVSLGQSTENEDFSLLVCRSSENGGSRISVTLIPKTEMTLERCFLPIDVVVKEQNPVFINGYQTWTTSREMLVSETIPKLFRPAWPLLSMYGDYSFYKYSRHRLQSWTYTYIRDAESGLMTLCGSLSEKSGYTVFEYIKPKKCLQALKDCQGVSPATGVAFVLFDLFMIHTDDNTAFDKYFSASGINKPRVEPCTGWTSWYNYYTDVTQNDVLENLEAFHSRQLPIDIFQLDDGYQEAVGDWLYINDKFPQGMRFIADEIHRAGYKAGLWLAPIICEKKSRIYKEHPDWVVGKAGFNPGWSGIFYTLDFYNPAVRAYLRDVFDTVLNKWSYDMVKLDFIYAAALPKRKDKTRGQVMSEFCQFLRDISGNKIILGCGVPLGCGFGLFDYCRVSSDVAPVWEDALLKRLHYRERVSTVNALVSTVGRYQLNGRAFYNDPDVFILRDNKNDLTQDQKYTMFLINSVLGGLVFTSDNMRDYSGSQLECLASLFALKDKQVLNVENKGVVTIRYVAGGVEYCLMSNLTPAPAAPEAPCSGIMLENKNPVSKREPVKLRPYESVRIRRK